MRSFVVASALAVTVLGDIGDKKHKSKDGTHGWKYNWDYTKPNSYPPYNVKTVDLMDYPATEVPGAGYVQCPTLIKPGVNLCYDSDAKFNYRIEAVERWFVVKGSKDVEATTYANSETGAKAIKSTLSTLLPWIDKNRTCQTIAKNDVKFITRTFQAMMGQPPRFNKDWCAFGGNGLGGMLGPCMFALPGEKLNILVKNSLHQGPFHIKSVVPTKVGYWMKMKNLYLSQNNIFVRDIMGLGSSTITKSKLFPSKLAVPNKENVPGWSTNKSWDVFNLHLHGSEVVPHIFDPMGTSNPQADWISIQPHNKYGQQCYCYKFFLDEHHGMGTYIYHTHRHGTTSMTTWGGMFGVLLTDVDKIRDIKDPRKLPPKLRTRSLMQNVHDLAKKKGLKFEDSDVNPFVIWNTKWRFKGLFPNNELMASNPYLQQQKKATLVNMGRVELNNYLPNSMPSTAMNPYLVNNEFRPTFKAKAGHLTWLKTVCVSTEWMCGIQLYYEETKMVVPFNLVAGDGITWEKPAYYAANKSLPTVVNQMGLFEVADAYLLMGGGNREDLLIQFPYAGKVIAFQTTFGGQNSQLLAYFDVKEDWFLKCGKDVNHTCPEKDLSDFKLQGARKSKLDLKTDFYKNMTFAQELDRQMLPYVQWGISDRQQNKDTFQMFDVHRVNMLLYGGKCSEWDICSRNPINHPYHIHVNPFQIIDIYTATFPGVLSCIPAVQKLLKGSVGEPIFRFKYGEWRDTAFVPPCGCLRLKQCFHAEHPSTGLGAKPKYFEGKFVFHCHFLTHEDTGLIHNVMIRNEFLPKIGKKEECPMKFPGAIIMADVRSCPMNDPCGMLHGSRGCSECPDYTWMNVGCSCIQPMHGIKYITMKDSLPTSLSLPKKARTSPARVVAIASLVGGCSSLAAFAVLMAVQRITGRARYSAAHIQVDEQTQV